MCNPSTANTQLQQSAGPCGNLKRPPQRDADGNEPSAASVWSFSSRRLGNVLCTIRRSCSCWSGAFICTGVLVPVFKCRWRIDLLSEWGRLCCDGCRFADCHLVSVGLFFGPPAVSIIPMSLINYHPVSMLTPFEAESSFFSSKIVC